MEGIATNPNTQEQVVIYHSVRFIEGMFFRPLAEFEEKFERTR